MSHALRIAGTALALVVAAPAGLAAGVIIPAHTAGPPVHLTAADYAHAAADPAAMRQAAADLGVQPMTTPPLGPASICAKFTANRSHVSWWARQPTGGVKPVAVQLGITWPDGHRQWSNWAPIGYWTNNTTPLVPSPYPYTVWARYKSADGTGSSTTTRGFYVPGPDWYGC